jgi:hypothetical protein
VREWLDGAAAPLARVLDKLGADERAAFIKAMDMLEAEFRASEGGQEPCPGGLGPGADGLSQAATPPANPG